jgi:hypothetical protein
MPPTPRSNRRLAVVLALAVLASPGCFGSSELSGVRRDLQSQVPGSTFDTHVELSAGPMLIGFAKLVASVVPGAHEARPFLRGVSRVQLAVYDTDLDSLPALRLPQRLESLLRDGWEIAVRAREPDHAVWLLYRPDGDSVREIFVVVLSRNELVLVKAKGRLEKVVAAVLDEAHGERGFARELGI